MPDSYLWDRSGEPDTFVTRLERGLAPLGDEADALFDELELELDVDGARADDDGQVSKTASFASLRDGAAVLELPAVLAKPKLETGDGSSRWAWLGAAAVVLLTLGVWTLVSQGPQERVSASVGGSGTAARVLLGVNALDMHHSSGLEALAELRATHQGLARCALLQSTALEVELSLALEPAGVELRALVVRKGEPDDATEACLRQVMDEWTPEGLDQGELRVLVAIEPADSSTDS